MISSFSISLDIRTQEPDIGAALIGYWKISAWFKSHLCLKAVDINVLLKRYYFLFQICIRSLR